MEIVELSVKEITPYEKNPRKNNKSVEFVANSIKQFGFRVPIILDKNKVIICGHTRLKAALSLGMDKVPCIIASDLNEQQVKALRLADNKVGENSEWDTKLLEEELKGIIDFDMAQFNFKPIEIKEEFNMEGQVPFTEVLDEEYNYVVLVFKNDVDWIQAQTKLGIKSVKALSTNKYVDNTGRMKRVGIGRVLDGKEVVDKIK